jgi:hypothetical protein
MAFQGGPVRREGGGNSPRKLPAGVSTFRSAGGPPPLEVLHPTGFLVRRRVSLPQCSDYPLRWVLALALAATVAGAITDPTPGVAATTTCTAASKWPCHGGDPGGRVLRTLQTDVYSAAKVTGDDVEHRSYDSYWITGNPCGFGQTGWSPTMAMATFASSLPRSALTQQIGRHVSREGWRANPAARAHQTDGAVNSWWRESDGRPVSVSLSQVPPGDLDVSAPSGQSVWALGASWQPQPHGVNCP